MKNMRRWLALILAIVLVAVSGFYQLGTSLQASEDENAVATASGNSDETLDTGSVEGSENQDENSNESTDSDQTSADNEQVEVQVIDGQNQDNGETSDASSQSDQNEENEISLANEGSWLTANEDGSVSGSGYDSITLEINTDGIVNQNGTSFNIKFDTGDQENNEKISASNLNPSDGVAKNLRKNNSGTFTVTGFNQNEFTITVSKGESSKNSVKTVAAVDASNSNVTLTISDYYESSYTGTTFTYPSKTSLGSVNNFAIFANNYTNDVDMEGNIAVKNLLKAQTNGGNSGNVQENDFNINYVENFTWDSMKAEFFRLADPLIVGNDYTITTKDSNFYLISSDGKEINLGPSNKMKNVVNIKNSDYKIEFDKAMNGLRDYASNLYGKSDSTGLVFKDSSGDETTVSGNVQTIECKADVNNIINIKASDLKNWADSVQLNNLGSKGSVTFNIEYNEAKTFTKPHFKINDSDTGGYVADGGRILLNFGTQTGTLAFGELYSGTILAPNASVYIYSTHNGSVFADAVENVSGEIHKNPWKPGKDDEQQSVSVEFKGSKTLDGQLAEDKAFSFILQETDAEGNVVTGTGGSQETVQNAAGGAIAFSKITYYAPGTYYYQITEVAGGNSDIEYDASVYRVTVTVDDTMNATVAYTKDGVAVQEATFSFVNTSKNGSGSVTFTGNKTLNGSAAADAFSYNVLEKSADGKDLKDGYSKTISNDRSGNLQFETISYTEAGIHYYEVTEVDNSKTTTGITFDKTVYTAVVNVDKDNSEGSTGLKTEVKYYKSYNYKEKTGTEVSKVTFANTMSASWNISGTKTLDDKAVTKDGEYQFDIVEVSDDSGTEKDGAQTVSNDATGKIQFPTYTYTEAGEHYYKITENQDRKKVGINYDNSVYIVKVTVSKTTDDDGNVSLKAEKAGVTKIDPNNTKVPADEITFNNKTIETKETDIQLTATKNLAGTPSAKSFDFELVECDENGVALEGATPLTASNDANGYIQFDKITYKEAGTHYYKMNEVIPEDDNKEANITYDETTYIVKVEVTKDAATGQLTASAPEYQKIVAGEDGKATTEPVETIVFNNGMTATTSFEGEKYVNGELAEKTEAGKYSFTLTRTDENYKVLEGDDAYSETVANDESGKIAFTEITYHTPGDYYYTISENVPEDPDPNMYYDEAVYLAKVAVSQDGTVEVEKSVIPYDGYEEDSGVAYEPVEDDEFLMFNNYEVELMSMNYGMATITGTKTLTGGNLEAGEFRFGLYDESGELIDTATNDASGNIEFRTLSYFVEGTYKYTVKEIIDQDEASSGNITYDTSVYEVTIDVDENMDVVITYTKDGADVDKISFENKMAVTAAVIDPGVTKELTNAELQPGEFTFQLFDENNNLVDTKKNTDSGSVLFDSVIFDKEGEYHFTIKELIPEDKGQIIYDGREIGVTVKVTKNDEAGTLESTVIYTEDGEETEDPTFVNTYHPISICVQKTSKDGSKDPLQGATYSLYRVLGFGGRSLLVDSQLSDANGYMTFNNVEPGIYYFKEVSAPAGHTVDEYATKKFVVSEDGSITSYMETGKDTSLLAQAAQEETTADTQLFADVEPLATAANTEALSFENIEVMATAANTDSTELAKASSASATGSTEETTEATVLTNREIAEAPGVSDEVTKLYVSKLDATNHEFVSGAKLQIIEKATGKVVEEWTTGESVQSFERKLNVETAYILHEVSAPDGYELAEDTEFVIDQYGILSITSGDDAEKTSDTSLSLYDKKLGVTETTVKKTEKHNTKYVDKQETSTTTSEKAAAETTATSKSNTVKTGDTAKVALFAISAIVAAAVAVVIIRKRKDS